MGDLSHYIPGRGPKGPMSVAFHRALVFRGFEEAITDRAVGLQNGMILCDILEELRAQRALMEAVAEEGG